MFPYQNFPEEGDEWNCAATLIGPRHAITAAHCFDSTQDPFEVTIAGTTHTVIETRLNPCYNLESEEPISADLAILVLDSDATPTPAVVYQGATVDGEEEVGETLIRQGRGEL